MLLALKGRGLDAPLRNEARSARQAIIKVYYTLASLVTYTVHCIHSLRSSHFNNPRTSSCWQIYVVETFEDSFLQRCARSKLFSCRSWVHITIEDLCCWHWKAGGWTLRYGMSSLRSLARSARLSWTSWYIMNIMIYHEYHAYHEIMIYHENQGLCVSTLASLVSF